MIEEMMNEDRSAVAKAAGSLRIFRRESAEDFDSSGMMVPTSSLDAVLEQFDLSPFEVGSKGTILFRGADFSLVHLWLGANFPLPRHSHDVDCLYYVLSGEAVLSKSNSVLAGGGFFVPAGRQYSYQAGPEGAEVLEMRHATDFDVHVFDQNPDRWKAMLAIAGANLDTWKATRPD